MNIIELQRLADMRGDNMASMVIQNFMEAEDFWNRVPVVSVGGTLSYGWNEEKTLPNAGSRAFNEDYTASNGETKPMQEALKLTGGKIGIDYTLTGQLGSDVLMAKQESQIKAIRMRIMNQFFNGSSATDSKDFDGLKSILPTTATGRGDRGYGVANGGGALSRAKLDEALDETDGMGNRVIFAHYSMPTLINRYGESLVTFDKNNFGVAVPRYGDVPIIPIRRNNLNADILGFGESGSTSSMFVANLSEDAVAWLSGQQGIVTREEKSGSTDNYQVDWMTAVLVQGAYNLTRLSGFTKATMVA
jgi:hypothetical protein